MPRPCYASLEAIRQRDLPLACGSRTLSTDGDIVLILDAGDGSFLELNFDDEADRIGLYEERFNDPVQTTIAMPHFTKNNAHILEHGRTIHWPYVRNLPPPAARDADELSNTQQSVWAEGGVSEDGESTVVMGEIVTF